MVAQPRIISMIDYPRDFSIGTGDKLDMHAYPTFVKSWGFSNEQLKALNKVLTDQLLALDCADNLTIVTAGSYGRMEAWESSDLDYMILTNETIDDDNMKIVKDTVVRCAEELHIPLPNAEGVFSKATTHQYLSNLAGSRADTMDSLSQRMLLLMETKPIFNKAIFVEAQQSILDKYLIYVSHEPSKQAVYLLNDAMRYFRSICVNYQFTFWKQIKPQ